MAEKSTRFLVGTSGFSYPQWKGSFYPEKLSQKAMLGFYASRFTTVECNNTFSKLPDVSVAESWSSQTPASFQLALKAPQTITHRKRLKGVERETDEFLHFAAALKKRCGPLLFQLPPNFKKDLPRLQDFLSHFAKRMPAAFEFRHPSWFDDEVYACLRKNLCALCISDMDDYPAPPVVSTVRWGYVRLRRSRYTGKQLQKWIETIESQNWKKTYVYFMHEETGTGPKFAARFLKQANA